jgi:hypothetical protein
MPASAFFPMDTLPSTPAVTPQVAQIQSVSPKADVVTGIVPIDPLPGNAGTGSWAMGMFWILPLLPLVA